MHDIAPPELRDPYREFLAAKVPAAPVHGADGVRHLRAAEAGRIAPTLFDLLAAEELAEAAE